MKTIAIDAGSLENELQDVMLQQVMTIVKKHEIKQVDCNECVRKNINCFACTDNPNNTSHYKPRNHELDKLFDGAPVMVWQECSIPGWLLTEFEEGFDRTLNFRLPTVKESPVNTWLAPGLEMPEGLIKLGFLARFPDDRCIVYPTEACVSSSNWGDVEAFMILEDFKR